MQWSPSGRTATAVWVVPRIVVEFAIGSVGALLLVWAIVADQQWFDRHFLPAFFVSRQAYVMGESIGRAAAAAIGLTLLFVVRPRAGRLIARNPWLVFSTLVAGALAIPASDAILSQFHVHATEQEPAGHEPRRRLDARVGWTFVPDRVGHRMEHGRLIEYAVDASGYRVHHIAEPVDPSVPTILFAGESMMVGEGLTWEESVPAQVGARLGLQSANIAVSAYATDQAYLRLQTELPRFRQPRAVVMLFTPTLFDRNMDDDRPHLGPGLEWQPAVPRPRLLEILRLVIRYRKETTIERGISVTREVLRATAALANAHHAAPLIVVPQFTPEQPDERALRHRVLDDTGLPVVRVELDGTWRIPGDGHPDARAASAIASAIVAALNR